MRCSSPSGPMRLMPWVRAWATRCAASWASTASNSVPGEPWGCGSWVVVSVMWCLLRCAIGTLCHGVTPLYLQSLPARGRRFVACGDAEDRPDVGAAGDVDLVDELLREGLLGRDGRVLDDLADLAGQLGEVGGGRQGLDGAGRQGLLEF